MKTSHTPGPWVMRNTGTSVAVFGRNGTEQIHCERNTPQDEANARLIAAAPELLAIAEEFVRRVEAGEIKSKETYRQFKEAIAKATKA